ncbi:MAG: MBOAT family O-acyltransferase [Clostridia bacterium]
MILSVISSFAFGFLIDKAKNKKIPLGISIAVSLSFLIYFKYSNFCIDNTNVLLGTDFSLLKLVLPIGISFYTFQTISYNIDLYRGNAKLQKNIINYACYVSFFPQLIAGPIVRYSIIEDQLKNRTHSWENFSQGAQRFTIGLSKKVLLANILGEFCEKYVDSSEKTMVFAIFYAVAYSVQIYLDFSAYSDMAIGMGKMFGFTFPENFNYPFTAKSVTDFWRRWHMTLGTWFRDYVYIPLGGNRVSKLLWFRNIIIVWLLTGFWHGAEWNFIIWGLYFAVFLILEKIFLLDFFKKIPSFFSHIYLILVTLVSFLIFASSDMSFLSETLGVLGGSSGIINPETAYYIRSYAVAFVLGIFACTPVLKKLVLKHKDKKIIQVLSPVCIAVLLCVTSSLLIAGSADPFLYFRF